MTVEVQPRSRTVFRPEPCTSPSLVGAPRTAPRLLTGAQPIQRTEKETTALVNELAGMFNLTDIAMVRDILEGEGGDADRCANRLQELWGEAGN